MGRAVTIDAADYAVLKQLAVTVPNFGSGIRTSPPSDPETLSWLAKLTTVANAASATGLHVELQLAKGGLGGVGHDRAVSGILQVLYNLMAEADRALPVSDQGAFIPTGAALDVYATLAKVLTAAQRDVMVVDPYLSREVVVNFLVTVPDGVSIRLLADEKSVKPCLAPAVEAFNKQFSGQKVAALRLAAARSLHDRFIFVDGREAWDVSQSFKDIAARSPGSISKSHNDLTGDKIAHYDKVWTVSLAVV